jgi:hypothetical protein
MIEVHAISRWLGGNIGLGVLHAFLIEYLTKWISESCSGHWNTLNVLVAMYLLLKGMGRRLQNF